MVIALFWSHLAPEAGQDYVAMADDVRHQAAQRLGRERWYVDFGVDIAQVVRSYGFERTEEASHE